MDVVISTGYWGESLDHVVVVFPCVVYVVHKRAKHQGCLADGGLEELVAFRALDDVVTGMHH